jgi:hypothetical protein
MTAATTNGISAVTMKNRFVERMRKLMIQAYRKPVMRATAVIIKNCDGVTVEV